MAENDRELKNTLSAIEKEFGKGSIMSLGETDVSDIQGIPTGALSLDIALGGKGLPRGRIIEIYGAESSGKTSIALHCVANAQKQGGVAAYIDAEHALDPSWAKRLGVDLESLLVSQPTFGEEALRIAEMLVKSNAVDIIVIDSVAALVPKTEMENEIGDSSMGMQARLMSQALRVLNPVISKTKTCVIFINQIRQKIGIVYGNPETTPGGLALKFYCSVRLEVRRGPAIKDGDDIIGNETKVKVVKNKIAPPFRQAEFELLYDRGISYEGDLLNLGVNAEIVSKSGSFFSYGDTRLGQGKENAREFLRQNGNVGEEIRGKILEKMGFVANAMLVPVENRDKEEEVEPEAIPAPKRKKSSEK
ncbi:recombinase RecA [Telmatocola sphagniphila]|uniref:Protein RecA n=1 Tax=Telmatocola sphagniphila TaxID=1123043 RepID=A0A8E6EXW6_9BACT|nr:recombinase RecA [Telmatocola sphagniphila]QVL32063.1 recombinase RecA [Telmatocola sphagniphila]